MAYSNAFHTSVDLLLRLHELMKTGKGDTEDADELRDRSVRPWYEMSEEEQELVRGLSADLYSIGVESQGSPLEIESTYYQRLLKDEHWSEALDFLRANETQIPTHAVAHQRGYCWSQLGFPQAAFPFFGEAARLAPDEPFILSCYLQSSLEVNRVKDALSIARKIIEKSKGTTTELLIALQVLGVAVLDDVATTPEYTKVLVDGLKGIRSRRWFNPWAGELELAADTIDGVMMPWLDQHQRNDSETLRLRELRVPILN